LRISFSFFDFTDHSIIHFLLLRKYKRHARNLACQLGKLLRLWRILA
jgi:hypothetical protein